MSAVIYFCPYRLTHKTFASIDLFISKLNQLTKINTMKNFTLILFFLIFPLLISSCTNIEKQVEEKINRIHEKADQLDSIIKRETTKVLALDSLINLESDKIKQIDSLVNRSAMQFDSVTQQKIERLKRLLE